MLWIIEKAPEAVNQKKNQMQKIPRTTNKRLSSLHQQGPAKTNRQRLTG